MPVDIYLNIDPMNSKIKLYTHKYFDFSKDFRTALVIDDNPPMCDIVGEYLERKPQWSCRSIKKTYEIHNKPIKFMNL